jgi:predicted CXXCH cytochrome family protein
MLLDLKEENIHKPFKAKECGVCHNPHASEYIANTLKSMPELCYDCHGKMETDVKASSDKHLPVEEGKCTVCHSPHGAKIGHLLLNRPKELCLSCHERIVITTLRRGHIDMEKGDCLSCHVSHYSASRYLLNAKDPALCVKCHSVDTERLLKVHIKPIDKIKHCLSCHVPHVTEKPGLLKNIKHSPFAKGDCRVCHE